VKNTLTIGGKTYYPNGEQQREIDRYRDEANAEIEAAGEADYPPNVIGCAPDRFKPIIQRHQKRVMDLMEQ